MLIIAGNYWNTPEFPIRTAVLPTLQKELSAIVSAGITIMLPFVNICLCFAYHSFNPFLALNFSSYHPYPYDLRATVTSFCFLTSSCLSTLCIDFLSFEHHSFPFLCFPLIHFLPHPVSSRGCGGVRLWRAPWWRADAAAGWHHQERAVYRGGWLDGGRPQREEGPFPWQLC